MQITIAGHHLEITEPLKSYVETKFKRLQRHFDNFTRAQVILSVEKLSHKAEAALFLGGAKLFAEATDRDMYAAIDALIDKLDRQVIKHKEKLTNYRQDDGGLKIAEE